MWVLTTQSTSVMLSPMPKACEYKLFLWFYTWSRSVFAIFHRHSLMYALISIPYSHAMLTIPALALEKNGWIFYRDWHRKSVWYNSFLQIIHRSREFLPFHFKELQSGIFGTIIESEITRSQIWCLFPWHRRIRSILRFKVAFMRFHENMANTLCLGRSQWA